MTVKIADMPIALHSDQRERLVPLLNSLVPTDPLFISMQVLCFQHWYGLPTSFLSEPALLFLEPARLLILPGRDVIKPSSSASSSSSSYSLRSLAKSIPCACNSFRVPRASCLPWCKNRKENKYELFTGLDVTIKIQICIRVIVRQFTQAIHKWVNMWHHCLDLPPPHIPSPVPHPALCSWWPSNKYHKLVNLMYLHVYSLVQLLNKRWKKRKRK